MDVVCTLSDMIWTIISDTRLKTYEKCFKQMGQSNHFLKQSNAHLLLISVEANITPKGQYSNLKNPGEQKLSNHFVSSPVISAILEQRSVYKVKRHLAADCEQVFGNGI